jgi:uncharacterized small protein (DUF1192 family)
MEKKHETFRLSLTADQKKAIQKATGKQAEALELSVEELEERIAPMRPISLSE